MKVITTRRRLGAALAPVRGLLAPRDSMLPGYLVVGAKRAGSTSLADWIAAHPQVGPCRSGKGTHYFDVNHGRGLAWYRSQFPRRGDGYAITGESSPFYMFHPLAPQWIAEALPEVKVVVCLREPVARAWSHHAYEVAHGREDVTSFERALELEPTRLAGEVERLVADPRYPAAQLRYHSYLARGRYAEQLYRLQQLMGPERVLVVQSEALFASPETQMARVFGFLGLTPFGTASYPAQNAGKPHGAMSPTTSERLHAHFAPLNADLYALPGVDFQWDLSHQQAPDRPTVHHPG